MRPESYAEAVAQNLGFKKFANDNDSYSFFKLCDARLETGLTRTNVNDFRAIYITG